MHIAERVIVVGLSRAYDTPILSGPDDLVRVACWEADSSPHQDYDHLLGLDLNIDGYLYNCNKVLVLYVI